MALRCEQNRLWREGGSKLIQSKNHKLTNGKFIFNLTVT